MFTLTNCAYNFNLYIKDNSSCLGLLEWPLYRGLTVLPRITIKHTLLQKCNNSLWNTQKLCIFVHGYVCNMHCIKLLLYYPGKFKLFIFMFNVVFSFAYLFFSRMINRVLGNGLYALLCCRRWRIGSNKNSKLVFAVSLLSTQHYCVHPSGTRFRRACTKQLSSSH